MKNSPIKWFNSKDRLPDDEQEVLVRKKGVVSLAKFDSSGRKFKLRDGSTISLHPDHFEWMELVAPEKG
jgi:hypothetical protein